MKRSDKIMFIGPRSRGGMDAVIAAYQTMIPDASFVTSYRGGSKLRKIGDFVTGYARAAWLLLRHRDISIVHIHSASGTSFRRKMLFARLAKRLGRKVVMHIHSGRFGDYFNTATQSIASQLNSCDAVICLSQNWHDLLSGGGVKNINVIPNPINYPASIVKEADDGKIHFLFLGMLDSAKGVLDLADAVINIGSEIRRHIVVHIAGTGAEEENLRKKIDKAGVDDCIKLEGWVTGSDKERLLKRCQCFVLPSYFEGQPVSILESMAWGMPIIATKVGGIPCIVEDGVNGILIDAGNVERLSEAIIKIAEDQELREAMSVEARVRAKSYSSANVADKLDKLYQKL